MHGLNPHRRLPSLDRFSAPALRAHIPELDGLRTIAALLVIMRHWVDLPLDGSVAQRVLVAVSRVGWCGVDLFFVLSGFLITGILFDAKGRQHYFRNFWGRRILRIFPLYYLLLAVVLLVVPLFPYFEQWKYFRGMGPGREWMFWTFLSNYGYGFGLLRYQFLVVSWSLCVEEHFYLLWPLFVYRYGARTLIRICGGLLALSFGGRFVVLQIGGGDPWLVNFATMTHLDGIALGIMIALLLREGGTAGAEGLWRRVRWMLAPATAAALLSLVLDNRLSFTAERFLGPSPLVITFGILVFSGLFALLLIGAVGASPGSAGRALLRWRPLAGLGKLTYAMYLLHLPVHFVVLLEPPPELGWEWLAVWGVSFVLLMGLCAASWYLLERPILSLKRYFPREDEPERSGGAPCSSADAPPGERAGNAPLKAGIASSPFPDGN
jgi:peptidoglycan/LPS O-acetylase OafA/YrhL